MAWHNVKSVNVCGIDGVMYVCMIDDTFVQRAVHVFRVDSEAARSVGLRVGIDYQNLFSSVARDAAKLIVVVVFPTPPFWFANAIIFPICLILVS